MSIFEVIFLAIALGIDCFVVSFSQGLIFKENRHKNSLLLAVTMGLFQGLMPFIGYYGAAPIHHYVESFSHWLVFSIFFILGLKFILDAFQEKEEAPFCIDMKCLVGMGVATSIDALVAGASIKFSHSPILFAALLIGLISFFMSLTGFWSANCFKNFPSKYLEIAGGIILIGLAINALMI